MNSSRRGTNPVVRTAAALGLSAALLALCSNAGATVVRRLGLEQLDAQSDLIVHGKVDAVSCEWTAERDRIFTTVKLHVEESFKTPLATHDLTFWQWGGTVDGLTFTIVGLPFFRVGEEVVLFLEKSEIRRFDLVGLAQGKLTVSEKDGEKVVRQETEGLELVPSVPGSPVREMPLSTILEQLRSKGRAGR